MVQTNRIEEIDWLRGFAIFLVVLGHAIIVYPTNLLEISWCNYLYNMIYSFHMPLFFVISGYCYSIGGGYKQYILKKAKRLLIPYFVFAIGGILPRVLFPGLVNGSETLQESINKILLHGGEYWFLYTLFIIFALFPLVVKALKSNCWVTILGIVVLGISKGMFPNIFCLRLVLYYLVFFFIGYLAKDRKLIERIKKKVQKANISERALIAIVAIISLLLFGYLHGAYDYTILNYIEAIIGIIACLMLAISTPELLSVFGRYSKYSLSLYLLNGYFLVISRTFIVTILGVNNPVLIIVFNLLIDFYVSYLLIKYILSKIPVVHTAIGIV